MKIKESTYIYRKEHSKKTYEQINLLSRREDRLKELIAYAAKRKGTTSQRYMKQAIKAQLQLDGVTVDSLPDRAESVKQD